MATRSKYNKLGLYLTRFLFETVATPGPQMRCEGVFKKIYGLSFMSEKRFAQN